MSRDDQLDAQAATDAISAAIARAESALAGLRQTLAKGDMNSLGEKAATAAATLYRESQHFIAHDERVARAKSELRGSIRRSPLAAVGVAMFAGLAIALFTRG